MSTLISWATSNRIFSRWNARKPPNSARIVYVPGIRFGAEYAPASSVVRFRATHRQERQSPRISSKRKIHTLLPPIFFGIFVPNADELCCVNLAPVNAKHEGTATKKRKKNKNPFVPSVPFCGGSLTFDTR